MEWPTQYPAELVHETRRGARLLRLRVHGGLSVEVWTRKTWWTGGEKQADGTWANTGQYLLRWGGSDVLARGEAAEHLEAAVAARLAQVQESRRLG